ncbi:MAG: PadR family transcriptional regulator [Deltaproteobacteria bacterium]|nr:PadR family transcriptional regulator [Deltaproteobacteria bacterium]
MKDKPSTEYAVLGALMSGPKHGYEILQFLENRLAPTWRFSTSQLYVLLKKLEKACLIRSSVRKQETRPAKRMFFLEPQGKKRFIQWISSPTEFIRDLRIEFLAKLFFYQELSIKGGHELVMAQISLMEKLKQRIMKEKKMEHDPYHRLVLGFRAANINGWLRWLKNEAAPFVDKIKEG